jgi:hypothetical protein
VIHNNVLKANWIEIKIADRPDTSSFVSARVEVRFMPLQIISTISHASCNGHALYLAERLPSDAFHEVPMAGEVFKIGFIATRCDKP